MKKRTVILLLLLAALGSGKAYGLDVEVNNEATLSAAITTINGSTDASNSIIFKNSGTIDLNAALPTISKPLTLVVDNGGHDVVLNMKVNGNVFNLDQPTSISLPGLLKIQTASGVSGSGINQSVSSGLTIVGSLDGDIDVPNGTFGIDSGGGSNTDGKITITGGIGSSSSITAQDFGIYGPSGVTINGMVDGDITVGPTSANANNPKAIGVAAGKLEIKGGIGEHSSIIVNAPGASIAGGIGSNGSGEVVIGADDGSTSGTGGVKGDITVTAAKLSSDANGTFCIGSSGSGNVTIYGGIGSQSTMSITNEVNVAYTVGTLNGALSIHGDVSGHLSSTTGGSYAMALYGGNFVTGSTTTTLEIKGNITSDASFTASAANSYALGIGGAVHITGYFGGDITATADSEAHGISSLLYRAIGAASRGGTVSIDGDITEGATISATATTGASTGAARPAVGIYGNSGVSIGGMMNGEITATTNNGSRAYGIFGCDTTTGSTVISGGIGPKGSITASAPNGGFAYGVYASAANSSVTIGQAGGSTGISGNITATAGSDLAPTDTYDNANAVRGSNVTIHGGISGRVTARAFDDVAYGISAFGTGASTGIISIEGAVSGNVSATASDDYAIALYALNGMHGSSADQPLNISGTLSASASGPAAAVLAGKSMNLLINGNALVSASDSSGSGLGYAIRSGTVNTAAATAGFIASSENIDQVTIAGKAKVTGKIYLGQGSDNLTLQGNADVYNVPELDGGITGASETSTDTLTMDGWHTDKYPGTTTIPYGFGGSVINWEVIHVTGNSDVYLGSTPDINTPMNFAASVGKILEMTIDAGSVIRATGASPGRYVITGNMTNNGAVRLIDGEANDRLTVTGTYTGGAAPGSGINGSVMLDVALGGGDQVNPEALDLLQVGATSTSTGIATGKTWLLIHNISPGNVISTTSGSGIKVVQVNGQSANGTFDIGTPLNDFGTTATVQLIHNADGNWYLVITQNGTGTGYVPPVDITTDPAIPPGGVPDNPVITVLPPPEGNRVAQAVGTLVPLLGLEAMPRFHEHQAYGWSAPGQQREPASWWSRTTGSRFNYGQESGGQQVRVSGYRSTMQVGSDLSRCGCGETTYRTGVFAGTGYLKADSRSVDVVNSGSGDVFTLGVGGYASVERRGHWYVEGVVQASEYDIDAKFSDGTSSGAGTWGLGVSVEGGAYVKVSDGFRLEPQAELMWQRIAGYGLTVDREHTRAEVRSQKGVTGRLGVTGTVMPDGWCVSPLVELNAVHDFSETPEVGYASTGRSYGVRTDRTWLGGAIGIVSRNRHPKCLEYYAKAGVMAGVDGHAGRDYTVTVGIRKSW